MRLTQEQVNIIKRAVTDTFGDTASVWLFGSRVDDYKRGGDIDLLIETEETDVRRIVKTELAFMVKLQMQCLAMHIQRWSWVKNYQKCQEIGHVMIAKVLFMN